MFELPVENSEVRQEHIWTVSFDASFAPTYPFVNLFANTGRGTYQIKPSEYAIGLWENEVQKNNFGFDGRGRNSSFEEVNGEYVVQKYLYNYDDSKPFEQVGKWFLYRAGLLHLRYAEAANRAGYPLLAYAIVNNGIKGVYNWDDVEHDGQRRQSGWGPDNYYPEPLYFDARESNTPYQRGPWRLNEGVRGRANLKVKNFPEDAITLQDSIHFMEKVIIEEAALECGFEGHRWGDMTRIARRLNREGRAGNQYLMDNLKLKYEYSGIAMPDYSDEAKWYLPFAVE
ncbi:MAG: RagB/SusD family nutrient uptake outer membrane protein [Bacteroides sp.]|nr:RagB/SusD family nutrient uptake outer membrane protein [Bacteroides sp.]